MPTVRLRPPHLRKEVDGGQDGSEGDETHVDPEPEGVVFVAGDGVGGLSAVIGEDEVGDRVEDADTSIAGNWSSHGLISDLFVSENNCYNTGTQDQRLANADIYTYYALMHLCRYYALMQFLLLMNYLYTYNNCGFS